MTVLIEHEPTMKILTAQTKQVEILDVSGKLVGYFVPSLMPKMTYPELGLTDEELQRRESDLNAVWYTHEQVMERLRQLDKDL